MRFLIWRSMLAGLVLVAMTVVVAGDAFAQCATCPQPTIAYQPVVAQPVVVQPTVVAYQPYTGWYPGRWLDRSRMRRAGVATTVPAYTAAYAPTYRAAYAPAYTAAYAPSYTAAYRPYVTPFAPLSVPVVVQTVARPVLMRPVVAAAPACNTCSLTPSCGCDACSTGCDSFSTGVSQAVYSEPACSSCAAGAPLTDVLPSSNSGAPSVGPSTGQPSYAPVPALAPAQSQYKSQRPIEDSGTRASDQPASDVDPLEEFDPRPSAETDPSTNFKAPRLLDPHDRTVRRSYKQSHKPTVNVWTAIYRGPAQNRQATPASTRARTQAEIDADGWTAVPSH